MDIGKDKNEEVNESLFENDAEIVISYDYRGTAGLSFFEIKENEDRGKERRSLSRFPETK